MKRTMRALLTVTAVVALATSLASPAFSQVDGFGHVMKEKKEIEYHQPARNDKAYKSALDQIPDAKSKYDPWGNVRQQPSTGTTPSK
jgi:hypothetical protein